MMGLDLAQSRPGSGWAGLWLIDSTRLACMIEVAMHLRPAWAMVQPSGVAYPHLRLRTPAYLRL